MNLPLMIHQQFKKTVYKLLMNLLLYVVDHMMDTLTDNVAHI